MIDESPFYRAFRGSFVNMLRWHELDALWDRVRAGTGDGWYAYAVGEPPPRRPATAEQIAAFVSEVDTLLRSEHDEDYCGIVYADDRDNPSFVKIYDPNHLGSVCGSSGAPPPLPGWVLSKLPPADLHALAMTGSRRRWWQRLFGMQK